MLAVVEHDQQIAVADHLSQPAGIGQVESRPDCRSNPLRIADMRQLDQARAMRQARRLVAGHLECQTRLAHPAGADECDEAMVAEQLRQIADLVVATDQRRQRRRHGRAGGRRQTGGGPGSGRDVERRVLDEDRSLQLTQLRPRVEPELITQDATAFLEHA